MSNRGENPPALDPYAPEPWQESPAPGPVLLIVNEDPDHRFGRFMAEILWAEGLNGFSTVRLANSSANLLAQYACVLVSAGSCTPAETEMLANYAAAGGKLVVFQPDSILAAGLGLEAATGTIPQGATLLTDPQHPLAEGIINKPLIVHVESGLFPAEGTEVVARLNDPEAHPAVFVKRLSAGVVVAWAYDLGMSIVLTRQGNPAMAFGADNKPLQRPVDLFSGWINFDRMRYPQADELQRLLANIVTWLCRDALPLPRLWYFPGAARSLLVASSDAHRNTFSALQQVTRLVERYSGTVTVNYTPPLTSDIGLLKLQGEDLASNLGILPSPYFPTSQQIAGLRANGHEITMHPYITGSYIESWKTYWNAFTRMDYGPVSPTTRTHNLEWRGWADAARIQASFGIRMNTDYYQYGPLFYEGAQNWFYGHYTGSGLPMRFADQDGRMLNIYQQVTQFGDEYILEVPWSSDVILGAAQGVETTTNFIQSSLDGNFAAITINCHSDPFDLEDTYRLPAVQLLTGTLNAAYTRGVPIWSVQRWLDFTTMRQTTHFEGCNWQEKKMGFDLVAGETCKDGLSLLIPVLNNQLALRTVRVDGQPAVVEPWKVGGVSYGLVKLDPGSHHLDAEYF